MDRVTLAMARLAAMALLAGVVAGMVEGAQPWADRIAGAGMAALICVPVMELLALRESFRRRGDQRYAGLTALLLAVLAVAAALSVFRHV
ncbi:MAG: hypothetical protein ACK45F_01465 [bacterium]